MDQQQQQFEPLGPIDTPGAESFDAAPADSWALQTSDIQPPRSARPPRRRSPSGSDSGSGSGSDTVRPLKKARLTRAAGGRSGGSPVSFLAEAKHTSTPGAAMRGATPGEKCAGQSSSGGGFAAANVALSFLGKANDARVPGKTGQEAFSVERARQIVMQGFRKPGMPGDDVGLLDLPPLDQPTTQRRRKIHRREEHDI